MWPGEIADLGAADAELRPRWVLWSQHTGRVLAAHGVRLGICWDLVAVHRMLHGVWHVTPGELWAAAHGLPAADVPTSAPPDLFSAAGDTDHDRAVRADGHLDTEWAAGAWRRDGQRMVVWAALALEVAGLQHAAIAALTDRPGALAAARAESSAELLCAELAVDGLPLDRAEAERIVAGYVGARPRSEREADEQRAARDRLVLRHAPAGTSFLLRNPGQVKSLLRATGIEVPDTRAWRLESMRDAHPVVDDLLTWRKAERVATTYGYTWLDEHVGADGRLRGDWASSDGAAGRMTASAGLHNMPAELRPAVAAEPGFALVRADLGQIEPRVLAAVSGDRALIRAADEADMYAPVAAELAVDRATAKVAVLGAMYGQTTGHGAAALRRLDASYPEAMAFLDAAAVCGQVGRDLRTHGGRLVRLGPNDEADIDDREARSRAAARGRYGRNAAIQGAAAELFKMWAAVVRTRTAELDARIVLCLHDELLVHAPLVHAEAVATRLVDALGEATQRWAPGTEVRFVADVSIVARWSDAKD